MTSYTAKYPTYGGRVRVAHRWPLVITMVMFALAFVPALGLINLALFIPMMLVVTIDGLGARDKWSRVWFGYLFLLASAAVTIFVSFATLMTTTA